MNRRNFLASCSALFLSKWGFIDTKGRFVIKPELSDAEPFYNGLAKAKVIQKEIVYDCFINHSGKCIVNLTKMGQPNP